MDVENGDSQGDDGKETEPGGDLQLSVAPADGEDLAEAGQGEEEDGAQDGSGLLDSEVVHADVIEVIGGIEAGDGPEDEAADSDEKSNSEPGVLWKGVTDGAEDAPGDFNEESEDHQGIDDQLDPVNLIEGGIGQSNADVIEEAVAEEAPAEIEEEDREGSIDARSTHQEDEEHFRGHSAN